MTNLDYIRKRNEQAMRSPNRSSRVDDIHFLLEEIEKYQKLLLPTTKDFIVIYSTNDELLKKEFEYEDECNEFCMMTLWPHYKLTLDTGRYRIEDNS